MTSVQNILPGNKFSRNHLSYIMALEKVQVINGNEIVVQINSKRHTLPIGITYKKTLWLNRGLSGE